MPICNVEINKATPTNFQLVFPILPVTSALTETNSLSLNIYSTLIPALTLEDTESRYLGHRRRESGALSFESLTTSFIIDDSFDNWQLIYNWMTYINDGYEKPAEQHSNFSVDAALLITNNFQSPVLNVQFVGMWPQSLGEVALSYREGEVQIEGTVTFVYDYYKLRTI